MFQVVTFTTLLLLAAPDAQAALRREGQITFEKNLPTDQAKFLQEDLRRLRWLPLTQGDQALMDALKLNEVTHAGLVGWLEERIKFIVSENLVIKDTKIKVLSRSHSYQNPELLPDREESTIPPVGSLKMLAANIGTGLYHAGKRDGVLLGYQIGENFVQFDSPRVGVIQVGKYLFDRGDSVINRDPWAMANTIYRLFTLFHEARHSDGNGKSLGFMHAICPEGHERQGHSACDRNQNGPYQIGGLVLRNFAEACTWCTAGEKEKLRLAYLESFKRTLPNTQKWDETPEWNPATRGHR